MKLIVSSALEGLDRNTRIWRIISHLEKQGHTVAVAGSGRGFGLVDEKLERTFSIAYKTPMPYETQEELDWKINRGLVDRLRQFQPEAMILDGEEFAAGIAQRLRIPTISIDHMHLFQYTRMDITIPPAHIQRMKDLKDQVKRRKYNASHYILPLFFEPTPVADFITVTSSPTREQFDQTDFSSIEETDEILGFAWPHIQADLSHFNQLEQMARVHIPLRKNRANTERVLFEKEVQGSKGTLRRRRKEKLPKKLDIDELRSMLPPRERFIRYEVADAENWFKHLAGARAVLMDGEITSITEAIALKKPMLLVPNPKRFDQWCYAHYVENMGFGEFHPRLTKTALEGFISRIDRYKENLEQAAQHTGPTLLEALDARLAEIRR